MNYIKKYFTERIERIGFIGVLNLAFVYTNVLEGFIYAFYGNLTKVLNCFLWGLFSLIAYYFVDYMSNRDNDIN